MKKHIVLIMNIVLVVALIGAIGWTVYNILNRPPSTDDNQDAGGKSAQVSADDKTERPPVDPSERYTIGIIQHANNDDSNDCYAGFMSELKERGLINNIDIKYIIEENDERCNTEIQRLINEGCDLLCTIGPYTSTVAASLTTDIPIVFAGVADPEKAGLVESNETPGGNITGVSSYTPTFEQVDLIRLLLPQAKKVAAIYSSTDVNATTQTVVGVGEAESLGMTMEKYPIAREGELEAALEDIKDAKMQAIYLPVDQYIYDNMDGIVAFANKNKIPVFVGNEKMLKKGALATCTVNYTSVGRIAAELSDDILFGKQDPASLRIIYKHDCYNIVNQASVDALGIRMNDTMRDQVQIKDYTIAE